MNMVRYAYIKNGDVISQLRRLQKTNENTTSGPDAFLNDLLLSIDQSPLLLIGHGDNNSSLIEKNIIALVYRARYKLFGKFSAQFIAIFSVLFNLWRFKPDRIICGRTGVMFWSCYLYSRLFNVPMVHSRHNQIICEKSKWRDKCKDALDYWCIRHARSVLCHGPYLKQQLLDIKLNSKRIFEFDIDFSDMVLIPGKMNSTYHSNLNEKVVLYIGRVQENKGIFDLLDAMTEILKNSPNHKLIYAGGGVDHDWLQDEVKTRGLDGRVLLLGDVLHSEIWDLLSKATIVVAPTQPTFPEGRCMAAMEALMAGVPVVAPDFGPFPFLIHNNEDGILYKAGSTESLKESVHSILKNPELYKHLKSAAENRSIELRTPKNTFSEAVQLSFS